MKDILKLELETKKGNMKWNNAFWRSGNIKRELETQKGGTGNMKKGK